MTRYSSSGPRPARHKRFAAAVAEFALIVPIIGTMVVGMFEMGRGLMVKELLSDAAQKGCRTGVLPGKGTSDIQSDVSNIFSDNNITFQASYVSVTVSTQSGTVRSVDAAAANPGDQISVKVSVPVSAVYWTTTFFLPKTDIESETVTMMKQGTSPYTPY